MVEMVAVVIATAAVATVEVLGYESGILREKKQTCQSCIPYLQQVNCTVAQARARSSAGRGTFTQMKIKKPETHDS